MVETFRERATGSRRHGRLEGLEFLANLLEWVFESYFDAFEEIEATLEEIDTRRCRATSRAGTRCSISSSGSEGDR